MATIADFVFTIQVSSMEKVPPEGSVFFKFEPFVLHVCCRTLDRAREMASAHLIHALYTRLVVKACVSIPW